MLDKYIIKRKSKKTVITKYFSSTAENISKHLKISENLMKDFEDEFKEVSN